MACRAFRVSSPRTLPFAPVLSALQVPHTQRLQELQGDDWLGLPLVHRYAGLSSSSAYCLRPGASASRRMDFVAPDVGVELNAAFNTNSVIIA
ncbi:hypothetical protein R6Z07F_009309 [Ovis aries]